MFRRWIFRYPFLLPNLVVAFLSLLALPFVLLYLPETLGTAEGSRRRRHCSKRQAQGALHVKSTLLVRISLILGLVLFARVEGAAFSAREYVECWADALQAASITFHAPFHWILNHAWPCRV